MIRIYYLFDGQLECWSEGEYVHQGQIVERTAAMLSFLDMWAAMRTYTGHSVEFLYSHWPATKGA